MSLEKFSIEEHTHRFGLWAAARAASTSRFTNSEIADFINQCQLKESLQELKALDNIDHEIYKDWFIKKANVLIECMNKYENAKNKKRKKSFGIAAKIISIYVKTFEVIPSKGDSKISRVAFPPIDRYLLSGLKNELTLTNISWSEMNEEDFMNLVEKLKGFIKEEPFWKLEFYWDLNKNSDEQTPDL